MYKRHTRLSPTAVVVVVVVGKAAVLKPTAERVGDFFRRPKSEKTMSFFC